MGSDKSCLSKVIIVGGHIAESLFGKQTGHLLRIGGIAFEKQQSLRVQVVGSIARDGIIEA